MESLKYKNDPKNLIISQKFVYTVNLQFLYIDFQYIMIAKRKSLKY
jgi:hypothetical protein